MDACIHNPNVQNNLSFYSRSSQNLPRILTDNWRDGWFMDECVDGWMWMK